MIKDSNLEKDRVWSQAQLCHQTFFLVVVIASLHPQYPLDNSGFTMLGTTH